MDFEELWKYEEHKFEELKRNLTIFPFYLFNGTQQTSK